MTTNRLLILFDTALGRCAIRWGDAGVTGVELPSAATRGPSAVDAAAAPAVVQAAIDGIRAVLAGESRDLGAVPIDERGIDAFPRRGYAAARRIPPGTTATYGQIARAIGEPEAARDVGMALARNPLPVIVPCHRVVAASGALTGFSAPGGLATKRRMLETRGSAGVRPAGALRLIADAGSAGHSRGGCGDSSRRPRAGYWSAFSSMASISAATSAAPTTPRGSLPFGQ